MKTFFAIAALAASAAAFSASSASAAAYMKYDGVEGESTKTRQHKPVTITKGSEAMIAGHKHVSDQVSKSAAAAGPAVAVGDVNGDGAEGTEKGHARVRGGLNPATDVKSPDSEPQPIGLLVPAVQKAR